MNWSFSIWILEDDTANILVGEVNTINIHHLNLYTKRPGSSFNTADGLRMQFVGQQKSTMNTVKFWIRIKLIIYCLCRYGKTFVIEYVFGPVYLEHKYYMVTLIWKLVCIDINILLRYNLILKIFSSLNSRSYEIYM